MAGVSFSGGATDFTATESSDFIEIGTKDGTNNTQAIDFEENTGVARYANVLFTSSGGGAAFERRVLLLQWGGAPTIDGSLSIVGGNNNIPASPTHERRGSVRVDVFGRWC